MILKLLFTFTLGFSCDFPNKIAAVHGPSCEFAKLCSRGAPLKQGLFPYCF